MAQGAVQAACFRAETLQPAAAARIEGLAVLAQGAFAAPAAAAAAARDAAAANNGGDDGDDEAAAAAARGDEVDLDAVPLEKLTVFVGTADGALLVYENRQGPGSAGAGSSSGNGTAQTDLSSQSVSLRLRVALKRFNPSKKAVSQLQFVEKWGILLSVQDGNLVAHFFGGEPLLQAVAQGPAEAIKNELGANDMLSSRSVVCYAVDPESDFICVAFKRLVVVLLFKASRDAAARGKFRIVRQLPMAETPRAMRWAGPDQICVGFAKDYAFFDIQTGAELKRPRMRTGGRKQPLMCDVRSAPRVNLSAPQDAEAQDASAEGNREGTGGGWRTDADAGPGARHGELLLCKDTQGFFVGFDGLPSRRGKAAEASPGGAEREPAAGSKRYTSSVDTGECVSWSEVPLAVSACQPFIVSAQHRKVEVHLASTCRRVQVLTLPGCTLAARTTDRLGAPPGGKDAHARRSVIFVASEKYVHVLMLRTLPEILTSLLEVAPDERKLEFALELCDAAGTAAWDAAAASGARCASRCTYPGAGVSAQSLHLIQADARARAALYYFRDCASRHDFKRAAQLLDGAKATGRLPLDFVTMLFARTELFDSPEAAETTSLNLVDLRTELGELVHGHLRAARGAKKQTTMTSPAVLALDFEPEYVVQSTLVETTEDLCFLRGAQFARALLTVFLPYALEYRRELLALRNRLLARDNAIEIDGEGSSSSSSAGKPDEASSAEERVLASINGLVDETLCIVDDHILRGFVLCDATSGVARRQRDAAAHAPGSPGSPSPAESAEMRAMMAHVRDQKMRFLRGRNWCSVERCEHLLLQFPESWETLLWLYFGKGQHENALIWLHKLEQNEGGVLPKLEGKGGARRGRAANSPYVSRTIEYLRRLGASHEKVVLAHAAWIVDACIVQDALEIFKPPPQVEPLVPSHVVERLEALDDKARADAREAGRALAEPIAIAYLEYAIDKLGDAEPSDHDKLATLYMHHVDHMRELGQPTADIEAKLLDFMERSQHLNASALAAELKGTDHFAAYALMLSRLGRHAEALRIYVDEMGSVELAEAYCARAHASGTLGGNEVFPLLVQTMVDAGRVEEALRLTERHPREVDASRVLDLMPADLPLAHLQAFLRSTFRFQEAQFRDAQVVKQLLKKEEVSARQSLARLRRRYSVVTQASTCANPKCGRHFLDGQAVARLPSGSIVHYACLKDLGFDSDAHAAVSS